MSPSPEAGGHPAIHAYNVSVVVPVYNVGDQLEKCLRSLIHQTLSSLEIIVLDDGSTDASLAIARSFADLFPERLRVSRKTNGGCASARMAGLSLAQGTFVGFVDGDDWVEPTMFESLHREAVRCGADIAQGGYQEVFCDGTVVLPAAEAALLPDRVSIVSEPMKLAASRPTIWRRIYRRDFLATYKIQFPEHVRSFDDTAFQFESFCRAKRVVLLPQIFYNYRQGREGQDVGAKDQRLFNFFAIFEGLDEKVISTANAEAEKQLVRLELDCHVWALGRIQPLLIQDYRRRALCQLGRRRRHLSRWQTLWTGIGMYRKARTLLLDALAIGRRRTPGHEGDG